MAVTRAAARGEAEAEGKAEVMEVDEEEVVVSDEKSTWAVSLAKLEAEEKKAREEWTDAELSRLSAEAVAKDAEKMREKAVRVAKEAAEMMEMATATADSRKRKAEQTAERVEAKRTKLAEAKEDVFFHPAKQQDRRGYVKECLETLFRTNATTVKRIQAAVNTVDENLSVEEALAEMVATASNLDLSPAVHYKRTVEKRSPFRSMLSRDCRVYRLDVHFSCLGVVIRLRYDVVFDHHDTNTKWPEASIMADAFTPAGNAVSVHNGFGLDPSMVPVPAHRSPLDSNEWAPNHVVVRFLRLAAALFDPLLVCEWRGEEGTSNFVQHSMPAFAKLRLLSPSLLPSPSLF